MFTEILELKLRHAGKRFVLSNKRPEVYLTSKFTEATADVDRSYETPSGRFWGRARHFAGR